MGYFGVFGQDPTLDGSQPPPPDPGTTDPSGGYPQLPGSGGSYPSLPGSGTSYPSLPGSGSSYPSLPGSGTSYPSLPGSAPPSGLQPYPGGSSTSLPGMPPVGGSLVALPVGQAWTSAPVVVTLSKSSTDGMLFSAPQNQLAAWIQMAVRAMVNAGYFDPGNTAAAMGAITALSQAYGYFMAPQDVQALPGMPAGSQGPAQMVNASVMATYLQDAYNSVLFWQTTPGYALATKPGGTMSAADIAWAARQADAAAAAQAARAAAPSSNTLLYVGLAGAVGVAAYLAFA